MGSLISLSIAPLNHDRVLDSRSAKMGLQPPHLDGHQVDVKVHLKDCTPCHIEQTDGQRQDRAFFGSTVQFFADGLNVFFFCRCQQG